MTNNNFSNIHLTIYLSIYLSMNFQSIYLPIYLSIYQSNNLSIYLSIYLFNYLSIYFRGSFSSLPLWPLAPPLLFPPALLWPPHPWLLHLTWSELPPTTAPPLNTTGKRKLWALLLLWVPLLIWVQIFSTINFTIKEGVILFIIIEDVYQFIVHCFIPQDN